VEVRLSGISKELGIIDAVWQKLLVIERRRVYKDY
jgi:hypothetical protein